MLLILKPKVQENKLLDSSVFGIHKDDPAKTLSNSGENPYWPCPVVRMKTILNVTIEPSSSKAEAEIQSRALV